MALIASISNLGIRNFKPFIVFVLNRRANLFHCWFWFFGDQIRLSK